MRKLIAVFILNLTLLASFSPALADATVFIVNTTDDVDNGICDATHCSLREAILAANANSGADTVEFDISGAVPYTIQPASVLPTISEAVTIDGTTEPDYVGPNPVIELKGGFSTVSYAGLTSTADYTTIRGLAVNRFDSGILFIQSDYNVVEDCFIGINLAGTATSPNDNGIHLKSSNNNEIRDNLISGNSTYGIMGEHDSATPSERSNGNVIAGNMIGVDVIGTQDLGNFDAGVYLAGNENTIGGLLPEDRNVISGSSFYGIELRGSNNVIQGNYIGTDVTGTADLGNGQHGIYVTNHPSLAANGNIIGGTAAGARNVISGNNWSGIKIEGYSEISPIGATVIAGNYIGTNATGTAAIGNSRAGIDFMGVSSAVIGGLEAGAGNLISGNNGLAGYGVDAGASYNLEFYGNFIGTDVTGTLDLGNELNGINIVGGSGHIIGELSAEGINLVSGNDALAMSVNSANTIVQNNLIGTDVTGLLALPNAYGVYVAGAGSIIGGTEVNETTGYTAGNIIAGNTGWGVAIGSGTEAWNNGIGVNIDGEPLGNGGHGVVNAVGDNTIVADNIIAYNGGDGIAIGGPSGTYSSNEVFGNSLFENAGLGIDLKDDGVTPNDALDSDSGPNKLINFPNIAGVFRLSGVARISGQLLSEPNQNYIIQIYASTSCDPSGYGEGEKLIGYFLAGTNGSGVSNFSVNGPFNDVSDRYITLLTYDNEGNTSEFSACSAKVPLFYDVPTPGKEFMQPWIEQFYHLGITGGCAVSPLSYCPEQPVTRAAMSVFLLRALNYPNLPHTPTDTEPDIFADVPTAGKEWMEPWIEEFYTLGITGGCSQSPLQFCPEQSVTRAALAVFILRALEGPDYQPDPSANIFADLPVAGKEWMEPWVNEFYNRGFTTGCNVSPLRYCPEQPVTRGAMAVFILRAFDNLPEP